MSQRPWIALPRDLIHSWVWTVPQGPFCRRSAWIDLVLLSDDEGYVPMSRRALADRWGWAPQRVTRFLATLRADGLAETAGGVYRVINYGPDCAA